MADRVALLRDGALVQLDTPQSLYHRPVDLFTAEFVGSPGIGVLPARLIVADGLAGYQVGTRVLPFWRPVPPELTDARRHRGAAGAARRECAGRGP